MLVLFRRPARWWALRPSLTKGKIAAQDEKTGVAEPVCQGH